MTDLNDPADGITVCDEIREFAKVYSSPKDSIKGQVFLNCWSLICCTVGHNISTSSTMPELDIWKSCFTQYQNCLQTMPMQSLFELVFVHFRNPSFEGLTRNKDEDLFDESEKRKNVPFIWPIGFLEWLRDSKEGKKTTAIMKNSAMKTETNPDVVRQCHL
jgi:hypothetical protein